MTADLSALIARLEAAEATMSLVEHDRRDDPQHQAEVCALGERIGFGALMSAAQFGWREFLRRKGYPLGGEFVAGPCRVQADEALSAVRDCIAILHAKQGEGE